MTIEQRIRNVVNHLRNDGKNQQDIAESIGVSSTSISDVINEKTTAGAKIILGILYAYPQVSAEWLIRGRGQMLSSGKSELFSMVEDPRTQYLALYNMPQLVGKVLELEDRIQDLETLVRKLEHHEA